MRTIQVSISYLSLSVILSLVACQLTFAQDAYNRAEHARLYPDYSQGGYNQSAHGQQYPDYSQRNNYRPYYGQQRYYNAPFGAPGYGTPYGAAGFTAPVPLNYGNGYYIMRSPTATYQFWKAPSGYYYPWYNYRGSDPLYGYGVATSYNQGNLQAQQPQLSVVYQDLSKFLLQAKTEGKLSDNEYSQLNRRLNDLIGKTNSMLIHEGTLTDTEEEDLRSEFDKLSQEVSVRLR